MTYIAEVATAPTFHGGAAAFWAYQGQEAILSGPYESGKTMTVLYKLHALLCLYPNSQALMVRKTYKSIKGSAVVTYEKKILTVPPDHPNSPLSKYGGESPEHYSYPNGSRLTVGGMDNADKFLSAEFDFIYVNQAEELTLDDWEKLMGRATGRAGNAPFTQIMGDCNPGPPQHWIKQRPSVRLFESRHEDNPTLFDPLARDWTAQGRKSLAILDSLTGVRYKRGRLGLWVAAEGQVYEYDPVLHQIQSMPAGWERWPRYRAIDFGYNNPFVCQWWAESPDSALILYRQIYMTGRTVKRHAGQIGALSAGENVVATICDHDAEDRATLHENGIMTVPADKRITVGIEKVQERLAKDKRGKARLYLLADSLVEVDAELRDKRQPLNTEDEFGMYTYPTGVDGKPAKEMPIDAYNHGMDALRYMVMHRDGRQPPRAAGSRQG